MITPKQKAVLLRDFLHSAYYCDLDIPRNREEIETIRDTMIQYKEWFQANVQNPPAKLINMMNKAQAMYVVARDLMISYNYDDLTELKTQLALSRTAAVDI